ncbi:MAG: radical SAM protein [Syntrophobacteraceae bacterium]|nr:radical SAM protein [Syntrophobacteraceae bacterium]
MLERVLQAGLMAPKTLTVSITNGCNLRCLHCWPQSRPELIAAPVPAESICRLIAEFVALGVEEVILSGGEPLTRPDWIDILAFCCRQEAIRAVCLQTNGAKLSEVEVSKLNSLGFAGLAVQVSLDGATEKTNDYLRGAGSFKRALSGLTYLVEGGLGKRTRVAFTEMRHNFDEIPALLALLENLGIGRVVTGTLIPKGRAAKNHGLFLPTPSQYRKLLERYQADPGFRGACDRMAAISVVEWYKGRAEAARGVCRCIESPYVSADGRMYPCALFQADEFSVADVFSRPLAEALREAAPLWSQLLEISRRRALELKICRGCQGRSHCAGGCMGRAYAAYSSMMREEDRCSLRKAAYTFS